jgi:hypothetical protein
MKPVETHLKGDAELMKSLNADFIKLKKSDRDDGKVRCMAKMAQKGCEHRSHWAIFIWIMGAEMKAARADKTALKWAKRAMRVFDHIGHSEVCKLEPNFELGGDLTAPEGKRKMRIRETRSRAMALLKSLATPWAA